MAHVPHISASVSFTLVVGMPKRSLIEVTINPLAFDERAAVAEGAVVAFFNWLGLAEVTSHRAEDLVRSIQITGVSFSNSETDQGVTVLYGLQASVARFVRQLTL